MPTRFHMVIPRRFIMCVAVAGLTVFIGAPAALASGPGGSSPSASPHTPAASVVPTPITASQMSVGAVVQQLTQVNGKCTTANGGPVGVTYPVVAGQGEVDLDLAVDSHCRLVVTAVSHGGAIRKPGGSLAAPTQSADTAGTPAVALPLAGSASCPHQGWSKATDIYGGFTATEVKITAAWVTTGSDHGCYGGSESSPVVVGGTNNTYCYANPGIQLSENITCTYSVGNYTPISETFSVDGFMNQGVGRTFGYWNLVANIGTNYTYSNRFYSSCYVDDPMPTGNSLHCSAAMTY